MIAYLPVPEVAPTATKKVLPGNPESARGARLHGMVYARMLVDEIGQVVQIGQVQGHPAFH